MYLSCQWHDERSRQKQFPLSFVKGSIWLGVRIVRIRRYTYMWCGFCNILFLIAATMLISIIDYGVFVIKKRGVVYKNIIFYLYNLK